MQVKLIRSVLVGDADVQPTRGGSVVDIEDTKAKEFIALGLAEEVGAKTASAVQNKMANALKNKAAK